MPVAVVLFAVFWHIERRSLNPLAPLHVFRRRAGDLGGLTSAAMATGVTFLMTVYLQEILGLPPVVTGLVFGVPGVLAIAGGAVAPRLIARLGSPAVLALGLVVQGLATAALLVNGGAWWVTALLAVCYFGDMVAIVAYVVAATSDCPTMSRVRSRRRNQLSFRRRTN